MEFCSDFFLGIGGITIWFIFQAYNVLYFETYTTDLNYYIDNYRNKKDKNGFLIQNKNYFSGLIVIVTIIVLLEKLENK